jgi:predicted permease
MAQLREQIRQVMRRLARSPLFTAMTLITLAIGIGATTVVFSVVDAVLLKPLNYPQSDRLIGVWHRAPGVNLPEVNMGAFLYYTYRDQNTAFEDIGCYRNNSVSVTGIGQPENVPAMDVTDGTLPLLGAKAEMGRLFTREDDKFGAPKTAVLTHDYWMRRFSGNPHAVGQNINVDGETRQIIGVLPRGFQFMDKRDTAVYLPFQMDRANVKLGNFNFEGLARLKPGVTLNQASADVGRMIPIALRSFPAPAGFSLELFERAGIQPNLRMLKQDVIGDIGKVLWVLMGCIAVVLLIACANVANLLLVRVEGRRQELAIRSALGANRANIAGQLLIESVLLTVGGSLLGLGLAWTALKILIANAPQGLPRLHEIGIHPEVLLFALGVALFVSMIIGIVPVLKYSGVHASTGLREGGRALSQSRERHRARKVLVVVQVALALLLLICSGLMIRTFRALANVSPGFIDPASLMKFNIYIPESMVPEPERVLRMQQAIVDRIAKVPGVDSAALGTGVPLEGSYSYNPVYAQDHELGAGQLPQMRHFRYVGPGYFATLGATFVAGRDLTWAESYQRRPVVIITENFAKEFWGSPEAALGKRIRSSTSEDWREIIGVVRNLYDDGADQPAPSNTYWPLMQDNFNTDKLMIRRDVTVVVRSRRAGSSALMRDLEQAVWSINADLPLADSVTLGEMYRKSMARTSFMLVMLCVAGGMALLLGIVGIYGVISYAVSQRTREIGIRMALGSQREAVVALFVRQGLGLAVVGVAAGVGVAALTSRLMASLLFNVSAVDPLTYAIATLFILGVAAVSSYLPSRRAAVVNPVTALRSE